MQEIKYARQESSAQCSERKEYKCRVCDGPVEWPDILCRECWKRDREEQEWESYLDFLDGDDTTPVNPEPPAKDGCRRSIPREQPKLIVLCGPSHVGKTTFARRLGGNFTVISSDEIRKRLSISFGDPEHEDKVWGIYESVKRKALKEGHNVVLDACHISKRARWHSLQGPNAHHRKICVVFDSPLRTIQQRCLKEKRMSLKKAERMWKDFQKSKPTREELSSQGFDALYVVKE
ncbi:MAG: ATP-binding protein [Desulfobacterales bacterium]|nr:ATP-binding protein [Desulfobacterales bacterium]